MIKKVMKRDKKTLKRILAFALISAMIRINGCASKEYAIESVAKADFDNDGIEDVVGYTADPFYNSPFGSALSFVNGKYIREKFIPGHLNSYLHTTKDKIKVIESNAGLGLIRNIENVSVEDVNGDGLADISYNMKRGVKKHKVYFNQGDGTLKGEF